MSAGLYELNGIISYSLNLEKKLKRKPNAKIIKVVENATEEDLIALIKTTEKVSTDDNIILYYFYNPETQYTISSIYQEVPEGYKKLNIKSGDKFAYKRINNTLS